MELTVSDAIWSFDRKGDMITLRIPKGERSAAQKLCDDMVGKIFVADIHPRRKSRSLDANAYAWTLIGKIADVLRVPKEEIHMQMLRDYGQSETISIRDPVTPESFARYYEEIGKGVVGGKNFTHYRIYIESHKYDSRAFSVYLDGIISEAKGLGIETIPPERLKRMEESI